MKAGEYMVKMIVLRKKNNDEKDNCESQRSSQHFQIVIPSEYFYEKY